jgi:hypothetical protein
MLLLLIFNPLKPNLVWIIFRNLVRTAKKTPHFTITKINWLTMFKETIPVYSDNHTKSINTKCSVTDLKQMVHILTARLFRVKCWLFIKFISRIRTFAKIYKVYSMNYNVIYMHLNRSEREPLQYVEKFRFESCLKVRPDHLCSCSVSCGQFHEPKQRDQPEPCARAVRYSVGRAVCTHWQVTLSLCSTSTSSVDATLG